MPFELRPEPHPTLQPEGDYLQRAWQQSFTCSLVRSARFTAIFMWYRESVLSARFYSQATSLSRRLAAAAISVSLAAAGRAARISSPSSARRHARRLSA